MENQDIALIILNSFISRLRLLGICNLSVTPIQVFCFCLVSPSSVVWALETSMYICLCAFHYADFAGEQTITNFVHETNNP